MRRRRTRPGPLPEAGAPWRPPPPPLVRLIHSRRRGPRGGDRQLNALSARGSEFDRAIAFFDATFAVALTLLVTTLDVDDAPTTFTSLSALDDAVGAQFFAFVIALAAIATYRLANLLFWLSLLGLNRGWAR